MKNIFTAAAAIIVCMGLGLSTLALPLQNSGEFMFTVQGNDPSSASKDSSDLEARITQWFLETKNRALDIQLEFYAKVDQGNAFTTTEGDGELALTYENQKSGGKWGTWQTLEAIDFYSVKAGNGYALYWVDQAATSGTWNTEARGSKAISHLSTWRIVGDETPTAPDPPSAVPEPSTLLLVGAGLTGLAALHRKRVKK